jgi:uncharacterized membrane protein YdjX (TVP38/TMEM64 family)
MEWLFSLHEQIAPWLPLIGGTLGGAVLVFLLTTTLTACSIPGVIIPMSLTGGVLLGPWLAVLAVATGAVTGSLFLFGLARRFGASRLQAKFGARLAAFEGRLTRYGPIAVVALRVAGAPGPLITAGAAATAMRLPTFALATLAGLLPSVVLASAGSSVLLG